MRSSSTVMPPRGDGADGAACDVLYAENLRPQSLRLGIGRRTTHRSDWPPMRPNITKGSFLGIKLSCSNVSESGRIGCKHCKQARVPFASTSLRTSGLVPPSFPLQLHRQYVDCSADAAQSAPHWLQGSLSISSSAKAARMLTPYRNMDTRCRYELARGYSSYNR